MIYDYSDVHCKAYIAVKEAVLFSQRERAGRQTLRDEVGCKDVPFFSDTLGEAVIHFRGFENKEFLSPHMATGLAR